jgi:hypothetical protein
MCKCLYNHVVTAGFAGQDAPYADGRYRRCRLLAKMTDHPVASGVGIVGYPAIFIFVVKRAVEANQRQVLANMVPHLVVACCTRIPVSLVSMEEISQLDEKVVRGGVVMDERGHCHG